MAPVVRRWSDLLNLSEAFDKDHKDFLYTTFAVIDEDDSAYFGRLDIPKLQMTFEQCTSALVRIPDEDLFPELSSANECFTIAPDSIRESETIYIKRPRLTMYEIYKENDILFIIPALILEEAHALQIISQHPHPGLVKFHGCCVRRGRITGLILDKYENDLNHYLKDVGPVDNSAFMAALESAVQHLHSIGLAHNDINPANILVNSHGLPVLIDFGSCREIGEKLTTSRGTPGWVDDRDDYDTSEMRHDIFAIEKIREWLKQPSFDC
jgi:serine/threonine protein kinase